MKALVISHQHHLLPYAWRLKQEGWDVGIIIDRDSWTRAWSGRFENVVLRGGAKRDRKAKLTVLETTQAEDAFVLCDSPPWLEVFAGYPKLYGCMARPEEAPPLPPILLGGWFDGEAFSARHLLVEDRGLWPGGLGPNTLGGLTLVAPAAWPEAFEVGLSMVSDELKAREYRGLVKVGVAPKWDQHGQLQDEPEVQGYQAGWNFLQAHAFLAEAGDGETPTLTQILLGAEPEFVHRYTVALPVSIPPYPHRAHAGTPSADLNISKAAIKCGKFYWHDMMVEDGVVKTAGLDGLVGVARSSAHSFQLAREMALNYARLLLLDELQVRLDVGQSVESVLAMLEARGLRV